MCHWYFEKFKSSWALVFDTVLTNLTDYLLPSSSIEQNTYNTGKLVRAVVRILNERCAIREGSRGRKL